MTWPFRSRDDQAWAHSPGWRRMVAESRADIAAGRVQTFDNAEDFLASLDRVWLWGRPRSIGCGGGS